MPRQKNEVERINVYMPTKLMTATRRLATTRSVAYSELIRIALREYILAETEKIKAARAAKHK